MTQELRFNLNDLSEVAQTVLKNVQSKTLLFYGDMGAGKTTLISAIVKELGVSEKSEKLGKSSVCLKSLKSLKSSLHPRARV